MAYVVSAYIAMASVAMACIVMTYILRAYVVMAYMAMAYLVMAYMAMTLYSYGGVEWFRSGSRVAAVPHEGSAAWRCRRAAQDRREAL